MIKKGLKYKFVGGKDFVGNAMYKNLLNKIFICEVFNTFNSLS